jgi:hypothetical protein
VSRPYEYIDQIIDVVCAMDLGGEEGEGGLGEHNESSDHNEGSERGQGGGPAAAEATAGLMGAEPLQPLLMLQAVLPNAQALSDVHSYACTHALALKALAPADPISTTATGNAWEGCTDASRFLIRAAYAERKAISTAAPSRSASTSAGLHARLTALIFSLEFNSLRVGLRKDLGCVRAACEQVTRSAALTTLLRRVLTVGNLLNQGTANDLSGAQQRAFSISSLQLLGTTRAADGKTSVLDYLAGMHVRRTSGPHHQYAMAVEHGEGGGLLQQLAMQLPALERAQHLPIADLRKGARTLRSKMNQQGELSQVLNATSSDSNGGSASGVIRLEVFVRLGEGELQVVIDELQEVEEALMVLASYLGEEGGSGGAFDAQGAFGQIIRFVTQFTTAVKAERKRLDAEAKRAKAAAKGAAAK